MKTIGTAICLMPIAGCAIGIGSIFVGLLYGIARNPSSYDAIFGLSLLGLAMIELFSFIAILAAAALYLA